MSLVQGGGLGYSLLFKMTWITLDLLYCHRYASLFLLTFLFCWLRVAPVRREGRTVSHR